MITIGLDTLVVWILVGLVAGFLASHLTLGHGLGIVGDSAVGIVGALLAGILSHYFGYGVAVVGHPIISEMIMAFLGAVILLLILRLFGAGHSHNQAVLH